MNAKLQTLEEKAEATVVKLLRGTQNGSIQWERVAPFSPTWPKAIDDVVETVYGTEYAGSSLRLYEGRFQRLDEYERPFWDERVVLELIDEDGAALWGFPPLGLLRDLLRATRVRTGEVEQHLDRILAL